ncbi:hypothetical protein ACOL3H_07075 [Aliarcobacter butzleri]
MEIINITEKETNKISLKVKIFLIAVFIISVGLNINGLLKSGIVNFDNGTLSVNEHRIPIYGWALEFNLNKF